MEATIIWQLGSTDPEAESNLARIAQWWASLAGQEIIWQQRPITDSTNYEAIDWSKQSLDETFTIQAPSLRGITLYWYKPSSPDERNISVGYLKLDLFNQCLDVLPSSGRSYQLRVTLPKIVYQKIKLDDPQFGSLTQPNGDTVLLFRDENQRLEIQINLSAINTTLLQQKISSTNS
ncbi:MAG: hypothetical protein ACK47D_07660 [Pseudanabaena sp.]|jgi:hypothetical protein|uniref:hypothetical protein n=1 Tax=Pseudanabaena mucicola TaxID=71190 RepID=UPI002575AC2A|nr:hypothetical protein [Pseudanabaena mucicola]MCA6574221.1 hypothetical protein [Pseudanabaena sp. M53BS1SP1A06MG]MCA6582170.1 hypothetical protein [Pseudanabaena sp. M34BS1SP1A06MG]MCA6593459.1 hypothetical protein [Pseudanabaena sp. M38BS1SP1A06MG]MCA6599393.1 hypothetical protein [Pseudanabaena sp. M57BS1SP1A06MG]MCA6623850.1 hypothetical protein [Pseudanabaena sp. M165S2SP1A06QC]